MLAMMVPPFVRFFSSVRRLRNTRHVLQRGLKLPARCLIRLLHHIEEVTQVHTKVLARISAIQCNERKNRTAWQHSRTRRRTRVAHQTRTSKAPGHPGCAEEREGEGQRRDQTGHG